ncbi:hypothetical protein [Amycolatopsis sp. WQ 127309]|nr:hypothetical protein [Amycolatopsis sp. WQ 127309]
MKVAPHVSGGAVDLALCTVDGQEPPMGTEVNLRGYPLDRR